MKKVTLFLLVLLSISCRKQTNDLPVTFEQSNNSDKFSEYDKVRLLSYNQHRDVYSGKTEIMLSGNEVKIEGISFIDDVVLSEKFKRKISNAIDATTWENCTMADCYNPRHILLFYQKDKLVGYYEFCAECGGSRQSKGVKLPGICTEQGDELIAIFKEMKLKNNGEETEDYQYF